MRKRDTRTGAGGRRRWVIGLAACVALLLAVGPERPPEPEQPKTGRVVIGDSSLELELALDPLTRFRGLSGRRRVPRDGGMLFVNPRPRPMAMVMRHCPVPIDVAFLDRAGRVVAMFSMEPEPPRRADESDAEYEARLPRYPSGWPAQFAVELAGGRLSELGVEVGQRIDFDRRGLVERAK